MIGRVQMFGGHPRRLSRSNSVSVISAEGLYKKGNRLNRLMLTILVFITIVTYILPFISP